MTDDRTDLAQLLPKLYEEEQRLHPEPTLEELLAYLEGELTSEQEDELQERLAFHPEATRLLLDLQDPSRLAGRYDDLPQPDEDTLRETLRAEGYFEPRRTSARWTPYAGWLAAAALLVLSVGLGLELRRRPAGDVDAVDVVEMVPWQPSRERDPGEPLDAVPGVGYDLLLYADGIAAGDAVRLEVVDTGGRVVLRRDTRSLRLGRVVLRLDPAQLEPGRYEIHLYRETDDEPLAVYRVHRRPP